MKRLPLLILSLLALPTLGLAQKDDWKRNRDGDFDKEKNALEGKPAPALSVKGWMNTGGKALELSKLKGKVVVLDFWGTW